MGGLHATATPSTFYPGDLIIFTTGLLIAVLLLALTLRAARLPGTPLANIAFAACGVLWCAGGLAHAALSAVGMPRDSRFLLVAQALQSSGAAAFPIPILAIWRPFAVRSWQKTGARLVFGFACLAATTIAILLWAAPFAGAEPLPLNVVRHVTALYAALVLILGAVTSLRRDNTPRAIYLPSLAMVLTVCGAALTTVISWHSPTGTIVSAGASAVAAHLALLVVLLAFLVFARFRFADLFLRHGIRILLAGVWAGFLMLITGTPHLWLFPRSAGREALHVSLIVVFANAMLLSFTFVDARLGKLLSRWLFRPPDYRAETRQLANRLRHLELESEIAASVEDAARRPLDLAGACLTPIDRPPSAGWPAGIAEGEIVERSYAEVLIPVPSAGRVTHVLLISPGPVRPGLVSRDFEYLRAIAGLCGNRFDALRREREAVERQSREALLLQQVTEAELRALRAQINPHFLFNSLNTIADLIVRDPPRAEAMTLRLASVFRHVLAHSARPLTSIADEMEFLRTYLYIEEARFGDRLQVRFDVDREIAAELVPSLILQPLVENALKHGLGPKPGPGHLWISARARASLLCLCVEDDGMGSGAAVEGSGLGLANVAERLATLYQDRASVKLEPREGGGSRVTVLIPRAKAVSAA